MITVLFKVWFVRILLKNMDGRKKPTSQSRTVSSQQGIRSVGVELKQGNGRSDLGQLMKYVALMVWEELHTERHDQLGLLLITPQKNSDKVWHQIGLVKPGIDDEFINNLPELPKNKRLNRTIEKLYQDHQEVFHSACRRLKLSHISWQELHEGIRNLMDGLNCLDPGEQTLYKLLEGFDTQVVSHSGTNTI